MATATHIDTHLEETLLDWLRDAHAMENQAEQVLSLTTSRIEHYPELRTQLERHLKETRRHVDLLRGCIERRGGSTSIIKDTAARLTGFAQAMSGAFVGDEIVKASLGSYVFEQMEIGSYKILIAAADACGNAETKQVCKAILREEEAMAQWLDEHLPAITKTYLLRERRGAPAKN
jgi:ferritin-like metal-binding protein YciE